MRSKNSSSLCFWFVWAWLIWTVLWPPAAGGQSAEEENRPAPIYVMRLEGAISPGTVGHLDSSLEKAIEEGAQALIIELDTPGGVVESMRQMVKKIMNAPIPVIVYVSPSGGQAASAGVMITLSADVAAMAPGTNIGAAHPVSAGGKDIDETMKKKVVNDMVAFIQGIAKERGRNAGWAKMAVEKSVSITADEALKINVVDLIAQDRADLLKKLDGREIKRGALTFPLQTKQAQVVELKESFRNSILKTLANPNIAYILMMLGLAGLYFELSHPGVVLPGVVGVICLILAFYSFHTLPVNYAGILLILLGLVLFILEIKVTSYGMLSVGGLVSLTLGSLMLFKTPEQYMRVSLSVMIPVVATVALFFILVTSLVIRAHITPSPSGPTALVGLKGPVKQWQGDRGRVLVHGEWWHATSDDIIRPGDEIVVTAVDGMRLTVKKADSDQA